jgi:hypothetical protein
VKSGSSAKTRQTRKRSMRVSNTTTIEMLHASFAKLDTILHDMIQDGASDSALLCRLNDEWKKRFHQTLSKTAAKGLLVHYRSIYSGKRMTRKHTRTQKGGMATLDYVGGQGTPQHTYGQFPVDTTTNSKFLHDLDATRSYDSSVGKSCTQGGGGSLIHLPAGVPSLMETVSAYTPVQTSIPMHAYNAKPYNPSDIIDVPHASSIFRPF